MVKDFKAGYSSGGICKSQLSLSCYTWTAGQLLLIGDLVGGHQTHQQKIFILILYVIILNGKLYKKYYLRIRAYIIWPLGWMKYSRPNFAQWSFVC